MIVENWSLKNRFMASVFHHAKDADMLGEMLDFRFYDPPPNPECYVSLQKDLIKRCREFNSSDINIEAPPLESYKDILGRLNRIKRILK